MSDRLGTEFSFREAVKPGITAVRRHWPALVLIQIGAIVLVTSYYRSAGLQDVARGAAEVKVRYGVWFAFFIGTLAGGVVPEFAKLVTGGQKRLDRVWLGDSIYNAFVYGVVGVQVDLFYRFQAFVFGPSNDVRILIIKTAVDMGLYAPIISIPSATLLYAWRRNGFRVRGLVRNGFRSFFMHQMMPGLIPCWFFWTPVLFCTYAMPSDLQLCFSMLAEAAWSIVFVFIAKEGLAPPP